MTTSNVKGETLARIWRTFQLRGHDQKVLPRLQPGLVALLARDGVLASEWYPISHYLALYGSLAAEEGDDEVVETACDSVSRGLRFGTWRVFLPLLAGLAPESFSQRGLRRFRQVFKTTFQPGEGTITERPDGVDALVTGCPFAAKRPFRCGVTGGLLSVPRIAGLAPTWRIGESEDDAVRIEIRWRRRPS